MGHRPRIKYSPAQKADIWDRWQRGELMCSIGRVFDRYSTSDPLVPNEVRYLAAQRPDTVTEVFQEKYWSGSIRNCDQHLLAPA